jgi:hypothetical protein
VRRPETAGDDAEIGLERLAERCLQLLFSVTDERDAVGLDSSLQEFAGEERPVAVGALSADDLASGDDDRRAYAVSWRGSLPCG